MMTFQLLRAPRKTALAGACCPLCAESPLLAGERMCHGCRIEALRLGVGRQ